MGPLRADRTINTSVARATTPRTWSTGTSRATWPSATCGREPAASLALGARISSETRWTTRLEAQQICTKLCSAATFRVTFYPSMRMPASWNHWMAILTQKSSRLTNPPSNGPTLQLCERTVKSKQLCGSEQPPTLPKPSHNCLKATVTTSCEKQT